MEFSMTSQNVTKIIKFFKKVILRVTTDLELENNRREGPLDRSARGI
jgi:hypothetical protein